MAERPIVNPTPKQVFQANKAVLGPHRDLMQAPSLCYALDIALLQYQRQMCDSRTTEGNTAAQNHFKIQGAHEFISILKHLAEMPERPPTSPLTDKLNYS